MPARASGDAAGYSASNGYDEGLSGRSNYGKQAGEGLYGASQTGLPHHQHGHAAHSRGGGHASSNPAHSHMHQVRCHRAGTSDVGMTRHEERCLFWQRSIEEADALMTDR